MIVSIHQPNYLPWTNLIHKIASSDLFIIFDDVQLPRGKSFVRRTKIKTNGGEKWITIPVKEKNAMIPINEIRINNDINWKEDHWEKIYQNYQKVSFFHKYELELKEKLFQNWDSISLMNTELIKFILKILKISTKVKFSSDFGIEAKGTQKIIDLLKKSGATEYLTGIGQGSKRYVLDNKEVFEENNIKLISHNFNETQYSQLHGNFIPNLSIIDMIFNIGRDETVKKLNLNQV